MRLEEFGVPDARQSQQMWYFDGVRCGTYLESGRTVCCTRSLRRELDANHKYFTIFSLTQDNFQKRCSDDAQVRTLRSLAVVVCDACMICNLFARRLILYYQSSYEVYYSSWS